jgi:hypothetical protein
MSPLFTKLFPLGSLIAIAIDQVMVTSIASIRASIRSISGTHHSASNICQASIICQHLPVTSAQATTSASIICRHLLLTALNLNNRHLNSQHLPQHLGQASQASQPASQWPQHLLQHWASISSNSASIWPASGRLTRVLRALRLYPLYWGVCHYPLGAAPLRRTILPATSARPASSANICQ